VPSSRNTFAEEGPGAEAAVFADDAGAAVFDCAARMGALALGLEPPKILFQKFICGFLL
jgi:4-aminobutyrate aminotransferase-like enzyme